MNPQAVFPKRGESSLTIPEPPAPPVVEKVEKGSAAKAGDKNAAKGKIEAKPEKGKAGKVPEKPVAKSKEKEVSKSSAKPTKPGLEKIDSSKI